MKIYLAGKISGDPDYQKKFNDIEAVLLQKGYSVMNPARLCNCDGFTWDDYMTVSSAMQQVCDATVLLADWQDSRGARIEALKAKKNQQKIYIINTEPEFCLVPFVQDKKSINSKGEWENV